MNTRYLIRRGVSAYNQAWRKVRLRRKSSQDGSNEREAQRGCCNVTEGVLGLKVDHSVRTDLIHILAKQATPMKANKTVLGRVPAKLSTLVINMRSMALLLSADAIVKPPMSSIMVGENMTENMYLV